ncbi:MAG: M28 family metallopeptidase [Solirubrobacteraceae bacterium]
MPPPPLDPDAARAGLIPTLREVCECLAPLGRTPCSPGEREAAAWIGERLRRAGADPVDLEDEPSWGTFPPTVTVIAATGAVGAALAARGRRCTGLLLALASAAGVLDEAENGPRIVRRLLRRRRTTVNVVGRAGDPTATRTLVVLAHHDAAQSGVIFDQRLLRALHQRYPERVEALRTSVPNWWVGLGAPLATLLSALSGRRGPARTGVAVGLLGTALMVDIWRRPTVPGANDNLSAVAGLVAIAERLRADPVPGLRVLLVSTGAEETLQDGIRAYVARHGLELDPATTWFLTLDTVGSPRLILVEGEGPFVMRDYTDPSFRDLIADCAATEGITLERGFRSRASADGVIPSRAGYPTAMLGSLTAWQAPGNYHLPTDTPDNLDYDTIADATRLSLAVARALANEDEPAAGRDLAAG